MPPLTLANGIGGFADEGRTYAIVLDGDQETPAPWVNVHRNPRFGTILSASGSATTWSENSRENRLTPFANDPVVDRGGEAIYVRDDDTGRAWSPTPGPMVALRQRAAAVLIRHSGRRDALLAIDRGRPSPARGLRGRRRSGADSPR